MVDRPVLEGYSAIFNAPEDAAESPLARKLFSVEGVGAVTIHDFTITLGRSPVTTRDWEPLAFEAGEAVREHLKAERPVVTETFIASIPPEEDIRKRLDLIIQNEINPGIASHGGAIQLHRVRGNTVYIEMMGGCQGCAASTVTLKQGIYQAFRSAVPQIGAILDVTDHSAGSNPYFDALPPEMQAYA
jgi:Fe-S cluster biogenesis protein NfuA